MGIPSEAARPLLKHLYCFVFLLFSCLGIARNQAQTRSTGTVQTADYSQEPFVVEQDSTEIRFENDGTGTRTFKMRVRIQSDAGVQRYAVLSFAYQSSTESVAIDYVRVRKPDTKVVLTSSDNVQDLATEITRQAPMYSDLREKHVAVKGLSVGDVLKYQALWKTAKPLASGQFWWSYNFSHDAIVLQQTLQISAPRDRVVKWKSPRLKPTITETDTRRVLTWAGSEIAHKSKEQEQKDRQVLIYQAGRGRVPQPDVQFSSFETWEEISRWYNNLQQERAKPTGEVRAKAVELTKGLTDDRAKASAIYNYVSSQVHYVAIELGIGRYQPHSAADVLSNQYGDCKDKHTLLAALLEAVGIRAFPALISSLRDFDPDVPSPAQFDHVISVVRLGEQLIWLDATSEVGSFGYLFSLLRGKKALLVPGDKPPEYLITTPADPPVKPLQTFRIDAKLSEAGTLQGKIERTLQGDDSEVLLRLAFRRTPMLQWKDLIQQLSCGLGFAGEVSEVTASSPEKTDEPFRFAYNYERKEYPDWTNRRLSSPLPPFALPTGPEKDAYTVNPIWLGSPGDVRVESHVALPKGYRPAIPKNLDVSESFAEYHRSFAFNDGILSVQRRLVVRIGEVQASRYEAYKKFAKVVADDYALTIPLSSGPSSLSSYQSEIWELPYSENADAVRAYDDAREKYTKNDLQGEIASLKRALEADPRFTRGWLWLGEIYKANGQSDDAVRAYRKAIDIDPQQAVSYKALGYTLLSVQKPEEAIPVWQQLIKVAPDDSAGTDGHGLTLLMLKRYAEAEPALETAAKLNPESSEIHLLLGTARLHAGEHKNAISAYQKALELAASPSMFNNIAYELAEENEELKLALEYASKAVSEEATASHALSLSQLRVEDLGNTRSLLAYWDTLGWVYFKMGDLEHAETYLSAAWTLSQSAVMADHLGQVYERQSKKQEAIRMYMFALSRASAGNPKGTGLVEKVRARLERLSPQTAGGDFRQADIASAISRMRTTKVAFVATESASAEFFLSFAQDERHTSAIVEDVKFISGSEKLKSAVTALRSTSFNVPLPTDGHPRLIRRGILFCSPHSGCSFTMLNQEDVRSVN